MQPCGVLSSSVTRMCQRPEAMGFASFSQTIIHDYTQQWIIFQDRFISDLGPVISGFTTARVFRWIILLWVSCPVSWASGLYVMFTAGPAVLCIGPVALFYVYNNNWKVTVNILPVTVLWASGLMLHQWCMKDNNSKLHQFLQHGARGSCFTGNLLTSVTSIMQLWLISISSNTFDYKSLSIIGSWVTYLLTGQWPQITSQLQKRLTCDMSLRNLFTMVSWGRLHDGQCCDAVFLTVQSNSSFIAISRGARMFFLCMPVADLHYLFFQQK